MIDSNSTKAPLSDGPRNMEQSSSGSASRIDSPASRAPISNTPVDPSPWRGGSGVIDSPATKAPCGMKPIHGYNDSAPVSERTKQKGS